ncbi:hypothetical protein O1611_g8387 [Lasiodiplodia mahajangana]|uniref:Uncharacterized protein n=1 Tax=Lasiodiplodia mahajangana TaxID=1108764 RepID=A0ACC2JCM0_9PEZI|nr:hypothetical protein O1611_g8387 [Lasiodiplodia mahajangana]
MQSTSTTASTKSDPNPKPRSKKHIYKPVPPLYRGPDQTSSSHLNINVGQSKGMMARCRDNGVGSSLSTDDNTSPSIIPSTRNEPGPQIERQPAFWDARPNQISTFNGDSSSKNPRSPSAPGPHSTMHIPTSPTLVVRSPRPPTSTNRPIAPPTVTVGTWEAPFTHYTVTYPGYNGTIQDFVTACIYIQLQYRRIRTSLYDDFIRAWVEGYLPYVKDCDEAQPPRKALRAIEWYNEIDDDPLFTSRVVTRQNLQSILDFYPDELEIARRSFGIASSRGPSKNSASDGHAKSHGGRGERMPSQLPTHAQQPTEKELIRKTVEVTRSEDRSPPIISKAQAPPFTTAQYIPAHKSFSGIEARVVQPKGLSQSSSDSVTDKKRAATDELRSEAPKRVSLGPSSDSHSRIWSDSGSTGSNHSIRPTDTPRSSVAPESTLERKSAKIAEDPEERRRRRLAKHFKKQMAGRESISSSAPIGGTPLSRHK